MTAPRPRTYGPTVYTAGPSRPQPPRAAVTWLTVAEVAAVLRVSKMTVYRLVHSGELAAVRVRRSFRVPERAFQDYQQAAAVDAGDSSYPSTPSKEA